MRATAPARETSDSKPFEFVGAPSVIESLEKSDAYSAAMAFIRGEVDVKGELIAAVRHQMRRDTAGFKARLLRGAASVIPYRLLQKIQSRAGTARDIRFHYDRSNDFYKEFLDRRLVYSCAYFREPDFSLDQAQEAKLEHICRKLMLRPGERFLDIGCGWGALVMHAAARYGVLAEGCTLSVNQAAYARDQIAAANLQNAVTVHDRDYRDISGPFDKIASVGMFEHVGLARLSAYFRKVYALLAPDGLFLNHGITRPAGVRGGTDSLFIARHVFPGGEIVGLADVIRVAELAGFEVIDVESLRRHYARTCRAWVERLQAKKEACLRWVDEQTWRIWQLYLAGSAVAFEDGSLGLHQVLMVKRGGNAQVPMTREHMYR